MPPLSNLATRDVETLVHPYVNLASFRDTGPLIIERGQGVYVYDTDGKAYIEGMAGLWCTALGYGNEELVEAAAAQMRKLSFAHLFTGRSHDPAIELAEKLKEIAPVPISKVFFCNSGSEANDTQVKLVWYLNNALGRPQEKKDHQPHQGLSRRHHRRRVADRAAGQSSRLRPAAAGLSAHSCPHHYRFAQDGESEEHFATRLAEELDALIVKEGPDTVAAFIAEPVMGAGGVIVPPQDLFRKDHGGLRQARRVHDQRRGDLRLRPARHDVRLRETGLQPAFDLDRQNAVVGLSADRRRDDPGGHVSGAAHREQKDRRVRPRLHLWRPSGFGGGGAEGAGNLCARPHRRKGGRARHAIPGAAARRSASIRWSAKRAGSA